MNEWVRTTGPLKVCKRCYQFALGLALMPLGVDLGILGVLANQDFKEKFAFVKDHAECQNCATEARRFGKCHC